MVTDKKTLLVLFSDFLLLENGMSSLSIKSYTSDINLFCDFLTTEFINHGVMDNLVSFNHEHIKEYLKEHSKAEASTQARFLCSMRAYTRFLIKENLITEDPCIHVENPRLVRYVPTVLSEQCVESFLNAPDLSTYVGARDRAMLETLYATGLRISELISLEFDNINFTDGFMIVRGKGDKERLIPLGENAIYYIEYYVANFRRERDPKRRIGKIFLSAKGTGAISRVGFWYRIKYYSDLLGIMENVSPHTFRHAFATHLLNHNADLRSVQMLLGHSSVTTTQIYTHVATRRMHQVYESAHPRAGASYRRQNQDHTEKE